MNELARPANPLVQVAVEQRRRAVVQRPKRQPHRTRRRPAGGGRLCGLRRSQELERTDRHSESEPCDDEREPQLKCERLEHAPTLRAPGDLPHEHGERLVDEGARVCDAAVGVKVGRDVDESDPNVARSVAHDILVARDERLPTR
jgi:hypothetical protein